MKKNPFGKKRRIKKSSDFKKILKDGKSFVSNYYKYFFLETAILQEDLDGNSYSYGRLGVIASKRVGNAVKRNYEKRLVREFFRLADIKNIDLVVIINQKDGSFHSKQRNFLSFIDYITV